MVANVSGAAGRKQRIRQRMKPDVGIRMARQRLIVVDPDAAKRDKVSGDERVDIISVPGANVRQRPTQLPICHFDVPCHGEFDVAGVSRDQCDVDTGPFRYAAVVGECMICFRRCPAVGIEDLIVGKSLGRLCRLQIGSWYGFLPRFCQWLLA